jgi:drug/metabolite transporter (DMT)-like permease
MPPTALALVLLAALMHALWNLLLKGSQDRMRTAWLASAVGGLLGLPFILLSHPAPLRSWGFAAFAALLEVVYLTLLSAAYARGDFSAVYPLARGSAPALLAVWAALLLGEQPSTAGWLGLVLLLGGLILIGWTAANGGGTSRQAVALALGVALCISCYSIVDAAGVRAAPAAAPYTAGRFLLTAVAMTPVVLWRARVRGRGRVGEEERGRERESPPLSVSPSPPLRFALPPALRTFLIGALSLTAYTLVLAAYAIAPVAYAGAIREVSVVFAAIIGWRWLGESFGPTRLIGALGIFGGILLIALAG